MLQKQMKNASFKYPLQIKINTQRLHQTKGKSINAMNYCNFVLSVSLLFSNHFVQFNEMNSYMTTCLS